MKNKFRVFLCLLFAVIMPFSFVGCGDKSTDDGGANGGQNSGGNSSPSQPEQESSYVLTEAEAVRILSSSDGVCDTIISKVNSNSSVLESNDYSLEYGDKTAAAFNYSSYPKLILDSLNYKLSLKSTSIEFGEVYSYNSNGVMRFIEFNIVGNNIQLEVVSWDLKDLVYFNFNFEIDNGEIISSRISQLISPSGSSQLQFLNVVFNVKNCLIEGCFVNLTAYFQSNESFFNSYFNAENFDKISSDYWGYSYYERISLYDLASVNLSSENGGEQIIASFDDFGFLNAFSRYREYIADGFETVGLTYDIFGVIDSNPSSRTTYSFDANEYVFVKNI